MVFTFSGSDHEVNNFTHDITINKTTSAYHIYLMTSHKCHHILELPHHTLVLG